MGEKFSSFERVVGDVSETDKEQILQAAGERFDDQRFVDLEKQEREKTEVELKIIDVANEATNKLRRKYGLSDFEIPPKNIHVIKEGDWPLKDSAVYDSMKQGVVMREQPANIVFLRHALHEMLHFKSYQALQVTQGADRKLNEYRIGLVAHTRDDKNRYFINLNEAVTEELTRRMVLELSDDPLFADEKKNTALTIKKHPHTRADSGGQLFNEDTYYATTDKVKTWKQAVGRVFGTKRMFGQNFTYRRERKIFNILADKIFEGNRGQFKDKEEVFEVFCNGMMTGNILPVGRLIDGTFGQGTLRRIGELDRNIDGQEEFVDSL